MIILAGIHDFVSFCKPSQLGNRDAPMLPATVQFIIAMIASASTDRLTRKMGYMGKVCASSGRKRFAFTADYSASPRHQGQRSNGQRVQGLLTSRSS